MSKYRDFNYSADIASDGTTYTDVFELDYDVIEQVDANLTVTSYTAGNVTVTPQISPDKSSWADLTGDAFSTLSSATAEKKVIATINPYIRFKIVAAGSANLSISIFARPGSGEGTPAGTTTVDSEASAAAASADATANPTAGGILAFLQSFNGTTWDRIRSGVTTISGTFTGMLNALPWAKYNATPTTRTDGQGGPLEADSKGNLHTNLNTLLAGENQTAGLIAIANKLISSNTYVFSKDVSSALEASSVSKASSGNLYGAFGVIDATAPSDIYYVQFLDSASLPADGAVTHIVSPIPVVHTTGTDSTFDLGETLKMNGVAANSGIVIVLSTTLVNKTISGSYLFATVLYK